MPVENWQLLLLQAEIKGANLRTGTFDKWPSVAASPS